MSNAARIIATARDFFMLAICIDLVMWDVEIVPEPGVCITCAGGALGSLDQCINCLSDHDAPALIPPYTRRKLAEYVEAADRACAERLAEYERAEREELAARLARIADEAEDARDEMWEPRPRHTRRVRTHRVDRQSPPRRLLAA